MCKEEAMKSLWVLLCLCLASSVYAQSQPVTVLEEGQGYQRIRISDPEYVEVFQAHVQSAAKAATVAKGTPPPPANTPAETREVVVIKTLRGLKQAGLPLWVETDILHEAGYQGWEEVTEAQLDAPLDTTSIDLDALSMVEQTRQASGQNNLQQDDKVTALGWFSPRWEEKLESIMKTIDTNTPLGAQHNSGSVQARLDGVFQGNGAFKIDISYSIRTFLGIPYGARFNYANVTVDATIRGQFGVKGSARYQLDEELLKQSISLWQAQYGGWLSIFQFQGELALALELGVKLHVEASTSFASLHQADGAVGLTWSCTSDGCTKTRDNVDLQFAVNDTNQYAVQVNIQLTPYADVNFAAKLDMYWGAIRIAKAKAGIVAALPLTYFGYYGDMCSDGNNDGSDEVVKASVLDMNGELYAYLTVEVLGKRSSYPIDLHLGGWAKKKQVTHYPDAGFQATVYTKNLLYKDLLSGGSSVFEPVLMIPEVVRQGDGITLALRSCYPFHEQAVTYEVDWGDGSGISVQSGEVVHHTWPAYGDYVVAVRLVTDEAGRAFQARWVSKRINVSPDGRTPFYPWLGPVLSILMQQ
jgi:PKD domain